MRSIGRQAGRIGAADSGVGGLAPLRKKYAMEWFGVFEAKKKPPKWTAVKGLGLSCVDVFDGGVWEPAGLSCGGFDLDPCVGLSENFYGETGFEWCG